MSTKGKSCLVQPIRDRARIEEIKFRLIANSRDYALFVIGINTALRANEILALKAKDVLELGPEDGLKVYQSKTSSYRVVHVNKTALDALKRHIHEKQLAPHQYIFDNGYGKNKPIGVGHFGNMVKTWCREVGLTENYGTHTLRKTWGYMQRIHNNTSTILLQQAFGHRHQWQTIAYLGIENEEISNLYKMTL